MKNFLYQFKLSIRLIIAACALIQISYDSNAQALKILPLGNSITQSNNENLSYRYPLWTKLVDDGVNFDFVGSMTSNYNGNPTWPLYGGQSFDQDHEGHWGWRVDQINLNLPGWMTSYTPDIVLIHLGTNDMAQNNSVTSTVNELKDLIGLLRADNPNVRILLATLIPVDDLLWSWSYRVPLLNAQIPSIADDLSTPESPVIIIDQYTGFDPVTDTFDGVHPNELGEEKMAQKWKDGIDNLMTGLKLKLNIFLEGPFNNNQMDTNLIELLPANQPFQALPWDYQGDESIAANLSGIVDWVLVEIRDAGMASNADVSSRIARQAALLSYDGKILNTAGSDILEFNQTFSDSLFVVLWHRNHLPVLSSIALTEFEGIFNYDFTNALTKAYSSSQKELAPGFFGLIAGDLNADGAIDNLDLASEWSVEAGEKGYLKSDVDFNAESNNIDKNSMLIDNMGLESGLPDFD
jgi:lysophospholipase L1-like esterase